MVGKVRQEPESASHLSQEQEEYVHVGSACFLRLYRVQDPTPRNGAAQL